MRPCPAPFGLNATDAVGPSDNSTDVAAERTLLHHDVFMIGRVVRRVKRRGEVTCLKRLRENGVNRPLSASPLIFSGSSL